MQIQMSMAELKTCHASFRRTLKNPAQKYECGKYEIVEYL
jgi:hypothetical protein